MGQLREDLLMAFGRTEAGETPVDVLNGFLGNEGLIRGVHINGGPTPDSTPEAKEAQDNIAALCAFFNERAHLVTVPHSADGWRELAALIETDPTPNNTLWVLFGNYATIDNVPLYNLEEPLPDEITLALVPDATLVDPRYPHDGSFTPITPENVARIIYDDAEALFAPTFTTAELLTLS